MKTKIAIFLCLLTFVTFNGYQSAHAQEPAQTARYFNGPTVSDVASTTAIFSLSRDVLSGITQSNPEMLNTVYFEYYRPNMACIAIYPTPEACLPKKTSPGVTSVRVADLLPNTEYTVVYKSDNTIRCVTAPCPDNSFQSLSVTFTTPPSNTDRPGTTPVKHHFSKSFGYRASGINVTELQKKLIELGYMRGVPTGYFGVQTLKAVKDLQRANNITPTGFVGPVTRAILNSDMYAQGEIFEGVITSVSTGCFADGECSITVDNKKVVTTIGWSQQVVGRIYGSVQSVGDAEAKIGKKAKVFAKKTDTGYTLYSNPAFYIEIQ